MKQYKVFNASNLQCYWDDLMAESVSVNMWNELVECDDLTIRLDEQISTTGFVIQNILSINYGFSLEL